MGNTYRWKPFFFFLAAYCRLSPLAAQSDVFVFNHLSVGEGLTSGEYNYYVHQTADGMVWISSISGLNRFDSRRVKQFHPKSNDPHSLFDVHASQSRFYKDPEGNLWFTNKFGLIQYDQCNDRFNRLQIAYPPLDTVRSDYLWMYLDSLSGELWLNAHDSLFVFNTARPDDVTLIGAHSLSIKDRMYPAPNKGYYLFQTGRNTAWLRLRYFKDRCESAQMRIFPTPNGKDVNDLRYVSDSVVWVATEGGLFKLDLNKTQWQAAGKYQVRHVIKNIVEIAVQPDGNLVVATLRDGIFFYDTKKNIYTGKVKVFKDGQIQPFAPTIDRMNLDRDNNLWISTAGDGVYYTNLQKPKFKMSLGNKISRYGNIMDIAQGPSNVIWILVAQGVHRIEQANVTFDSLKISGRGVERATFIQEDQFGRVWVGTLEYLFLKKPGEKKFSEATLLPTKLSNRPGYQGMTELPNGDILMATNDETVFWIKYDLSISTWLKDAPKHPAFISSPNNQHLFVYGIDNTLQIRFPKENFAKIDTSVAGIPYVTGIEWDHSQKVYWVATLDGLYQLMQKKDSRWSVQKFANLRVRSINSILVDETGKLWLGTANGLVAFEPNTGKHEFYDLADGLPSLNFIAGSAVTLKDGQILFGTANGLIKFHPKNIRSRIAFPRPAITEIRINQSSDIVHLYNSQSNNNPTCIDQLRLPYDKNNLYFKLSAKEFSKPPNCQFRYQLLGSTNEGIVDQGNNDELNLANLSPGRYTLNIWASNSDGVWSEHPRRLKIEILPPWYQTWWFFMLLILLIAGVFYGLYRYRLRELMQRQTLEKAASEAKQLAAETETAVLRLQMNPHFIFNSLNSIDAYILGGDKLKAHDYLIRFADLMRGILNNSEKAMNSIDDEIELLTKYLDTEQMRIGPRLSYAFVVAPEVDTYETEIPTMILQPFVENAIWHGISPKNGPGHIRISFRIAGGELVCEVTDDGVGRKAASGSVKKHESKALSITHRRLALLGNEAASRKPSCTIHDEVNEAGRPDGTRVRVCFPMG